MRYDQIVKNRRASVKVIEKYYTSHLANALNATAINVRAPKRRSGRPANSRNSVNKKK